MLGNSISGVIFDLDGTLADTSPDIAAALNAALRDTGQTLLPVPEVISMIGDGIPTLVERAIARLGASGSLQDVMVERMLHHYDRDYCVHSKLMVGVADCLDALRDLGLPMAVCTNKDQVIARKIVTARASIVSRMASRCWKAGSAARSASFLLFASAARVASPFG